MCRVCPYLRSIISDMRETTREIVRASTLPLSIGTGVVCRVPCMSRWSDVSPDDGAVIVGVGNADFKDMVHHSIGPSSPLRAHPPR